MEQVESSTAREVSAPRPPVLSYHGPTIPTGDAPPSYLAVAAVGLFALLLFSLGIYLILELILNSVGTSGWVMIGCLAAPFCFLGGAMVLRRIGRRRWTRHPDASAPESR